MKRSEISILRSEERARAEARSLPYIGWKACEQAFYLDALPITPAEAVQHWQNGTARFGSNAQREIKQIIQDLYDDADCSPAGPM